MPTRELDVLVVGAGPAGLAAARTAALAGARVLVVEREGEIGSPVRTSGASWLADLDELGIPRSLAHPLTGVRFAAPDRQAAWRFAEPLSCVLDVRGVWQNLAREAIAAGAEIKLRTTVLEPLMADGAVQGAVTRDSLRETTNVRATVTIDASGSSGAVGVKAGLRTAFHRVGVGAEYELLAPNAAQSEAWLIVGRQAADRGYAWLFPRGNGQVRLGVGVLRPDSDVDPMRLLQRLMVDPRLAAALEGAQPLEYHAGALPAEQVDGPLSMPGLLLAGDSGSQASPLVGEGIRYAIRAGRLAGEIAARRDPSGEALAEYDRDWERRFGQEMRLSWWLNRRLARYGDRNWRVVAALLGRLSPAQVADGLRGRFSVGWWLGLAAQSPVLLATAIRAALASGEQSGQNSAT